LSTLAQSLKDHAAKLTTADEKAQLWPTVAETYKGYAGYQRKTDRDIPLVICEPLV
jgi:hypothetical protein